MRGRDGKSNGEKIPTLREVVQPGGKNGTPPNLDLFDNPPSASVETETPDAPSEAEQMRQAFIEELDRRVENLIRSRVQRMADNLAEDVMKTLKREIRNIAKDQEKD